MSSDEETGYGSIETPKVESPTSRRRVAVVAALALFGLVVLGSPQEMRMAFWGGEGGDDQKWDNSSPEDSDVDSEWWRESNAASG